MSVLEKEQYQKQMIKIISDISLNAYLTKFLPRLNFNRTNYLRKTWIKNNHEKNHEGQYTFHKEAKHIIVISFVIRSRLTEHNQQFLIVHRCANFFIFLFLMCQSINGVIAQQANVI